MTGSFNRRPTRIAAMAAARSLLTELDMTRIKRFGLVAAFAALLASPASAHGRRSYHDYDIDGTHYRNSDGFMVHRPDRVASAAFGRVSAVCRDGTFSYSRHRRGTCNFHGGVARRR